MSMTRLEHLLTIAAEECTEIGQRISKAIQAVMELLEEEGVLPSIWVRDSEAIERKKRKVELFLCHSFDVGTMGEEGIKPLGRCNDQCDGCKRVTRCINAGVPLPKAGRLS